MNLAPIALFVYSRLDHTQQTIESLRNNELAKKSTLFVFSDGGKDDPSWQKVEAVRDYLDRVDGFEKITLIKREANRGLASSIEDGVSQVVNEYGKVIVVEDDLVSSPYFLTYMNRALEFYKDKKEVWHISGWNCPIDTDSLEDVFLWRLMNCWGWGTWADRWAFYERDIEKCMREFTRKDIVRFNLDGAEDFFVQIRANKKGTIHTWAVFWYATIFKKNGLCVNPSQTFIRNIGLDESGEHCTAEDTFDGVLSNKNDITFSTVFEENKLALQRIQDFYIKRRGPLLARAIAKAQRTLARLVRLVRPAR